jgi:MFS family permease
MGGARERLRESGGALAEVFRNPGLRRLNIALAGSVIGDWAYAVGVSVYAYTQGGATAVGVLGVVRYVSMAALLPLTSVLADKLDRKRVMVAADLIRVVLVLIAAAVIELDGPALAVYALAILTSLVGTAFRPAQAALMPSLATHPGELTAANVASSTIESVGFFLGPAIGGALLAVADVATVYVFDAITFLWSAVLVMGLRRPTAEATGAAEAKTAADRDGEPAGSSSMFAGAGDGYREIFGHRDIRLLVGLYCAQTIVAGASLVFGVAIALDLLDLGESGVGLLDATVGVGGLIGGFVALVLAQRGKLARDFGIGVIMWSAPLVLIAAWPTLPAALAAMVLIGVANSVVDVNAFTILQRLVPDAVMGRVFGAVESAIIAGMALGSLLMPLLINTIGLRSGLAVIGAGVTVLVIAGLAGLHRIDQVALAPAGLNLLRGVPMLGVLPEVVLERLARVSELVRIPAGRTVFTEGDPGDRFYVIESGTVDVSIRGDFVRSLGPGDSFGEIALLRDIPRTATVIATTDLVLRAIDRGDFLPAVTGHGDAVEQAELVVTHLLVIS